MSERTDKLITVVICVPMILLMIYATYLCCRGIYYWAESAANHDVVRYWECAEYIDGKLHCVSGNTKHHIYMVQEITK